MVKAKHYVWLRCSQCGRRFGAATRAEALRKLTKHLWLKHGDWMKRRIKLGLRKAKKLKTNPRIIGALEAPLIEKLTGRSYDDVKSQVLDTFVRILLSGLTPKG